MLAFMACASPVAPRADVADYYGMKVGLVRVYRARFPVCGRPVETTMTKTVSGPLAIDIGTAVVIEVRLDVDLSLHAIPGVSQEAFAELPTGWGFCDLDATKRELKSRNIRIELAKPVAAGTTWTVDKAVMTIAAIEDVEVRAGRFARCARVSFEEPSGEACFWFAPGVGMVKGWSGAVDTSGRHEMEYELVSVR